MMMRMRIARARSAKQSGISWGQKLLTPTSYDIMFRLVYFAQRKVAVKQPVKIIKYFFENVVDEKKSVCYPKQAVTQKQRQNSR